MIDLLALVYIHLDATCFDSWIICMQRFFNNIHNIIQQHPKDTFWVLKFMIGKGRFMDTP